MILLLYPANSQRGVDGHPLPTEDADREVGMAGGGEQGPLQPMVEVTEEIREEYQYEDDEFEVGR